MPLEPPRPHDIIVPACYEEFVADASIRKSFQADLIAASAQWGEPVRMVLADGTVVLEPPGE